MGNSRTWLLLAVAIIIVGGLWYYYGRGDVATTATDAPAATATTTP
jgi:cbb3-type cytochrome oxidase subunit 3